jgi:hypothetical protein
MGAVESKLVDFILAGTFRVFSLTPMAIGLSALVLVPEIASTGLDNTATVTFTNTDTSNSSYNLHNVFLNVSRLSERGACTQLQNCGAVTGTGTGNGPYYFVSNQSGGFGTMTYNVDDTGTPATSVSVDLTATGGNSWASSIDVLTPNAAGYDASVDLVTQSGLQAAGTLVISTPEPSGMLLPFAGLLALGLLRALKARGLLNPQTAAR